MYLFFNNPIARAVATSVLLVVVIAVWLVRRFSRAAQPSGFVLDLLAVLMGGSVVLALIAIPLPPALFVAQLVLAIGASAYLVAWAMRKIDPSGGDQAGASPDRGSVDS